MNGVDAIRLRPDDNVATVLRAVAAGETLYVLGGSEVTPLVAQDAIPLCHKISLGAIEQGRPVRKYGQSIGNAIVPVAAGRHVHIHNLRSARASVAP